MTWISINFWICLFPLLTLPTFSGGGSEELPSHFRQLKGEERVIAGLQICDSLAENPETLLSFALPLLKDAEKSVPGTLLMARVLRHISDGYYYADSMTRSCDFLLKSIALAESLQPQDTLFIGSALNDLGMNLDNMGKRIEARRYLLRAIDYLEVTGNQESLADARSNLASLFYAEGNYEEAIRLYNEAYQIDLQRGNSSRQSTSLNNLGRIYVDWGKYETGLEYYFRSVALLDTIADRRIMAVRYNNIGMAYQLMKKHSEAIRWIEKARLIDEEEGMVLRLGTRYFNLATSLTSLREYEKAGVYFAKADSFYAAAEQIPALAKVHAGFGQMYLELGDTSRAITHFLKSLEYAETGGSLPEQSLIYNQLYRFYKETGDFEQSLRFHERYTAIRDSVFNLEVSGQVEEMEVQYQTAQKEAEIARLEAENEIRLKEASFRQRERNWALAGSGVLLLFLGGLFRLFRTVKRQKMVLANQNEELEQLNRTQNRLFGIISHDLRNATAAYQSSATLISYHLDKGQPEKLLPLASEIRRNARNLSGMLENLLQWSLLRMKGIEPEKRSVSLKDETEKVVELVRDYAQAKATVIDTLVGDETVWCDPGSLELILRNLIGNAVKFTSAGRITISAFSDDGHTVMQVKDTGCGMDQPMVDEFFSPEKREVRRGTAGEKGTGLGLQLVVEHVACNGGSIDVESQPGEGTTITVKLPSKEI